MCFTFKKNNKQTKKPVNCFLQDDASAGIQSLQTSIEIKLCQNHQNHVNFCLLLIFHELESTDISTPQQLPARSRHVCSFLSTTATRVFVTESERFKTRAAHFPIQRDGRTGMQLATLGKSGSEVTRSDSESIFQQQFGEYHGYNGCYSIYFDSSTIVRLSGLL